MIHFKFIVESGTKISSWTISPTVYTETSVILFHCLKSHIEREFKRLFSYVKILSIFDIIYHKHNFKEHKVSYSFPIYKLFPSTSLHSLKITVLTNY